jgi:hypothetical protein
MSKSVTCILHEWFSHIKTNGVFFWNNHVKNISRRNSRSMIYAWFCNYQCIYKVDKVCRHSLCGQRNKRNTTGATGGAGATYPSGAPVFTPILRGVRVARSLVVCVMFCRSLFVLFSFRHCIVCPSSWYLQFLIFSLCPLMWVNKCI